MKSTLIFLATSIIGALAIPAELSERQTRCPPIRIAPEACPYGEYYTDCGTACPITCGNLANPPQVCIALCVAGCFCVPGTYRNKCGQCVPKDLC